MHENNVTVVVGGDDEVDFLCNFHRKKAINQSVWLIQKDQSITDVNQMKMHLPKPKDMMFDTSTRSLFVFYTGFNNFNGKV